MNDPYPAEVAAAHELSLHPEEAKPRAQTFVHERQNWIAETAQLRAYAEELRQVVRALLEKAVVLCENSDSWFWRCRHCNATGPAHNLKPDRSTAAGVEHAQGCVVAQMRDLTETRVRPV